MALPRPVVDVLMLPVIKHRISGSDSKLRGILAEQNVIMVTG